MLNSKLLYVRILCSNDGRRGLKMAQVQVPVKNGNLDMALKKLKQKMARESIPSECKKREYAVKPGDKRREAKKAGIKNAQKRNRSSRD
jgi:ribosomal protein S21